MAKQVNVFLSLLQLTESIARGLSGQRAPNPAATEFRHENEPVATQNLNMAAEIARIWGIQSTSDLAKSYSALVRWYLSLV